MGFEFVFPVCRCFEYVCWGGYWFCNKFCPCPRDDRCCQVKQALLGVDQVRAHTPAAGSLQYLSNTRLSLFTGS